MKRIAACILAVSLLTGLCACQPDGSSASSSAEKASAAESIASQSDESKEDTANSSEEDTSEESTVSRDESSAASEVSEMGEAEYTIENDIPVVYHNGHYRALSLLGGGSGNSYVSAVNTLRERLDSSVRIYSATAPLPSEYYIPANYEGYVLNQKECFDEVAGRFNDGIEYVDIDTALSYHTAEDIYLRTDHHWTPLGAYYAAAELAKAAGVPFKELSSYKAVDIEGYVGTMSIFTESEKLENDPELFRYYIPDNYEKCKTEFFSTSMESWGEGNFFIEVADPQSNAYITFMGGDEQIVKVTTDVKNGRKLMIVKDSFGNAIPSCLFGSFEEIMIVDMRYCDVSLVGLVNDEGITDLALIMDAYSMFGNNADDLEELAAR